MPKSKTTLTPVRRVEESDLKFQFRGSRILVAGLYADFDNCEDRLSVLSKPMAKSMVKIAELDKQIKNEVAAFNRRITQLTTKRGYAIIHARTQYSQYDVNLDEFGENPTYSEDCELPRADFTYGGLAVGCRHISTADVLRLGKLL